MGQPAACVATILCYELHSDYWSYLIIIIDVCSIILRSELFCRGCWSYLIIILCLYSVLWFYIVVLFTVYNINKFTQFFCASSLVFALFLLCARCRSPSEAELHI